MELEIDSLPYRTFKRLKSKYPEKKIFIPQVDFNNPIYQRAFHDIPSFVKYLFAQEGVEVYRFTHDYKSLDGPHPQLGLVFLANDSVIVPGIDVSALIGHNARYLEAKPDPVLDLK